VADTTGQKTADIGQRLIDGGHGFEFVQAMRLARLLLNPDGEAGVPGIPWLERTRVRADLSLAFPASDVKRIEKTGDDGSELLVTATFLGLYGSATPLPTFVTETLLDELAADESVCRDFLDAIQERTYHLRFQGWEKYRLAVRAVEEKDSMERERLCCLIGLGEKSLAASFPDVGSLLRFTSILAHSKRSGYGLETILRFALKIRCVQVIEDLTQWAPVPAGQRMRLGMTNCTLHSDAVLGTRIEDRRCRVRIRIGPLTWEQYNSLLPGTPLYKLIWRLVGFVVFDPLVFDLQLVLDAGEARPFVMDGAQFRLGFNTFLCSGRMPETGVLFPLSVAAAERDLRQGGLKPPLHRAEELPRSLVHYYRDEMAILRDRVGRYVKAHPSLAAMANGPKADPGVERLLEGTAFSNAMLRMKLEDGIPEIIDELTRMLHPYLEKPVPATAVVAFTPGETMHQSQLIPAGSEVASIQVDGTACRFRTCHDVLVHPLRLIDASFSQPPGKAPSITLRMDLRNSTLSGWRPGPLRFFLGNSFPEASNLRLLLTRHLDRVIVASAEGEETIFATDCLRPIGLDDSETLLPNTPDTSISRQILHEHFLFPHKSLFMEFTGLERWSNRGNGRLFDITLELSGLPFGIPKIDRESFVLFATPVINLFRHESAPVPFTADGEPRKVEPAGNKPGHYQVYSVDRVIGLDRKLARSQTFFEPSDTAHAYTSEESCRITCERSLLGDDYDTYLELSASRREQNPSPDLTLNIDLTCSNGLLPEQLHVGDIRLPTGATPHSLEFHNVSTVTPAIFPPYDVNRPWRLLAGLSLNYLATSSVDNFRSILRLYSAPDSRNQALAKANEQRINGIIGIDTQKIGRVIRGRLIPGYDIRLKLCGDCFSGPGDLYLFSSVLERFLGGYVTQNCFTRLMVENVTNGQTYEWPARMGDRHVV